MLWELHPHCQMHHTYNMPALWFHVLLPYTFWMTCSRWQLFRTRLVESTSTCLRLYEGTPLTVLENATVLVRQGATETKLFLIIMEVNGQSLLSARLLRADVSGLARCTQGFSKCLGPSVTKAPRSVQSWTRYTISVWSKDAHARSALVLKSQIRTIFYESSGWKRSGSLWGRR